MNRLIYLLALIVMLGSCSKRVGRGTLNLIPYPAELQQAGGELTLAKAGLVLEKNQKGGLISDYLRQYLPEAGLTFADDANIRFISEPGMEHEAYVLDIDNNGISCKASGDAGFFYAIQSLRQLLEVEDDGRVRVPFVHISDYPRFKWRGMHLDVSRHFFTVEEIKRFLDYMAINKLNTFHWHLVDDQGWRLEIKKYPRLTSVGAWREKVGFTANQEKGLDEANTEPYGGYYSQEQVRDIVKYAGERNITVVPEIELPGHSAAALVAYPEYYCPNAGKLEIWDQAGVSAGVYCAGNDKVFDFLNDILDETMDLFPGEFIHIGGDETPKDTWLACPDCQKRMQAVGARDEHELQSYFISRIEKHLNAKGRRLIGWDEILDGGLAPNAAVMSWRGVAGGIKAARAGHDVVMTPMFPYYFNHTQNDLPTSPGHPGISTLRDVYTFPVIPEDISEQNKKHIIGIQANMWTEYLPKFRHLEYNLFPRVYAIAEVAWSPETRTWVDFYGRVESRLPDLKAEGINVGDVSYHVGITVKPDYEAQLAEIEFIAERPVPVYYTTDGSKPDLTSAVYEGPFKVSDNVHIMACQFRADGSVTNISEKEIIFHKAFGKPYTLKYDHAPQYDGGSAYGLTNGFLGVMIGVEEKPLEALIDLGKVTEVNRINSRYKNQPMSWVFGPKEVIYSVSADGTRFEEVARFTPGVSTSDVNEVVEYPADFDPVNIRFVKIEAIGVGVCPPWHPAAGGKAWLFSDEIIVE